MWSDRESATIGNNLTEKRSVRKLGMEGRKLKQTKINSPLLPIVGLRRDGGGRLLFLLWTYCDKGGETTTV